MTQWLPELWYLEGTEHNEDVASALDGTDGARRVRSPVTYPVDVVEQWDGGRRAKEEIALWIPCVSLEEDDRCIRVRTWRDFVSMDRKK